MNEELQKTINLILLESIETLDETKTFLAGEIPEVLKQFLIWEACESAFWFIFAIALLTTLAKTVKMILKQCDEKSGFWYNLADGDPDFLKFGTLIVFTPLLVISLVIFSQNLDWLKILVAPKVYLLEYTTNVFTN